MTASSPAPTPNSSNQPRPHPSPGGTGPSTPPPPPRPAFPRESTPTRSPPQDDDTDCASIEDYDSIGVGSCDAPNPWYTYNDAMSDQQSVNDTQNFNFAKVAEAHQARMKALGQIPERTTTPDTSEAVGNAFNTNETAESSVPREVGHTLTCVANAVDDNANQLCEAKSAGDEDGLPQCATVSTLKQGMTGAELLLAAIAHAASMATAASMRAQVTPPAPGRRLSRDAQELLSMSASDEERCTTILTLWEKTTGTTVETARALDKALNDAATEEQNDTLCAHLMDAGESTVGTTVMRRAQMTAALTRGQPVECGLSGASEAGQAVKSHL